ncbi:MAG: AbrB/MazE/SpoVT family DNA-binding domain-containing protein [Verrucomicrobiota bacterium]
MTSKGQITIPKKLREKLNLRPGDVLDFQAEEEGFVAKKPEPQFDFEGFRKIGLRGGRDPYGDLTSEEVLDEIRGPVTPEDIGAPQE